MPFEIFYLDKKKNTSGRLLYCSGLALLIGYSRNGKNKISRERLIFLFMQCLRAQMNN